MNSVSEDTSSKKVRRRSRRKNKTALSSHRSTDEDEKPKQIKKGCKTCTDHVKLSKTPMKEQQKSLENGKVPPNTDQSDSSDSALFKVLEKGKKLRDAMVLSMLEDTGADMDKELLLEFDQIEKECAPSYKPMKVQKSGEIVTPREEKLISDYLKGKPMKEEEEILVLNALHADNREMKTETETSETVPQKEVRRVLEVKIVFFVT
ncbi:hypothetical protein J6590_043953 [Homalodisca vitripennis]|nr:hypothetical protein J6590_043953 [Homalodisca vitripennis]